jgi:hypothetical protein
MIPAPAVKVKQEDEIIIFHIIYIYIIRRSDENGRSADENEFSNE